MRTLKTSLIILTVALLASHSFGQEWSALGPMSSNFYDVAISPHDADHRLTAFNNTLWNSEDGGNTWDVLWSADGDNSQYVQIRQVEFDANDAATIYFITKISWDPNAPQNGLQRSVDGGETFSQIHTAPITGYYIHPVTGKMWTFKDGDSGNLYESADDGETWTQLTGQPNRIQDFSVDLGDDDILYAGTWYGLYRSLDGGSAWDQIAHIDKNVELVVPHPTAAGKVYSAYRDYTEGEMTKVSSDSGSTWTIIDLPYNDYVVDRVHFIEFGSDPNNIYMVETNEVFISHDGGLTWSTTVFEEQDYWYAMGMAVNVHTDLEVIAVSEQGSVRSLDGGDTWGKFQITSGSVDEIATVTSEDGYHVYAGGSYGVNRYDSGTGSWMDYTTPGIMGVEVRALATDPSMPELLLNFRRNAINNALLYRSTDMGGSESLAWDNMSYLGGPPTELVNDPLNPGIFYATTWWENVPGEVLKSTDFGETWNVVDGENNNHNAITDVVVDYQNDGTVYTFGDGPVAVSHDGGETWESAAGDLPFEGVWDGSINPFDGGNLIVAIESGLYGTYDGGSTWTQIDASWCKRIEFSPYIPGVVSAITQDDDLLMSFDGGDTWAGYQGDMPAATLNDLTFSVTGNELLVATRGQGVYVNVMDISSVAPSNLNAVVDGFNVTLSWDGVELATAYRIYRDGEVIAEVDAGTTNYYDYYLLPGSYEYHVSTLISGIEAGFSAPVAATINVNELPAPVELNTEVQDYNDVVLGWDAPEVAPVSDWLHYDSGNISGTYNAWMGSTYDLAIKFDPEDLAAYDGLQLTQIKFVPANEFGTYNLKVWTGDNSETLVYEQVVNDFSLGVWNTVALETPYVIDASQTLTFGFSVNFFGGDAFTYDEGPAVEHGYSDLVGLGGTWYDLNEGFYIDANLNIQGLVESPAQREGRMTLNRHLRETLEDFNVYRDGLVVGSTGSAEVMTYSDEDVDFASYDYAVTAVYDTGESLPSNISHIDVISPYIPPVDVFATQVAYHDAVVTWDAPEFSGPQTVLQYDSGNYAGAFNSFMGGNYDLAVKWDGSDLTEYDGQSLTTVSFIPVNAGATYTLKIWTGDAGDNLVYEEALSGFTTGEWNDFTLSTPIIVDDSQALYVGFNVSWFGGDGFSYDEGPAVRPGYSGLLNMGGTWYNLYDAIYVDANLNIHATVEGEAVHPEVTAYKVYRDSEEVGTVEATAELEYTDTGLSFGPHDYNVTAVYDAHESVYSETFVLDMYNPYEPPVNLMAEQTAYTEVQLAWEAPVFPGNFEELRYDDGEVAGTYNAWMGSTYDMAIKYEAADLAAFDGLELTEIGFIPVNDLATYTLKVWTGDNGENTVVSQAITEFVEDEWNVFTLETAHTIDASQALYLGFTIEFFGGDAFTYDAGPGVTGYGGLVGMGGTWYSLMDGFYIDANLNISGYIPVEGLPVPVLSAYNIYRDDEIIATLDSLTTDHLDTGLEFGDHVWAVTAQYGENESVISEPVSLHLVNPYLPPVQVTTAQVDVRDVEVSWTAPSFPDLVHDMRYDSGVHSQTASVFSGGLYEFAIKYDPADLEDYDGTALTHISFIPVNEFATYTLKVWSGTDGETVLVDQVIADFTLNDWNEVALETEIIIDASQTYYFGYTANVISGDVCSLDEGPAIRPGYSNLLAMGGWWYTVADLGYDANLNIVVNLLEEADPPAITGYNVYRDDAQIATIEDLGTFSYTDSGLEFGTYAYTVTTQYDVNESPASPMAYATLEDPYHAPMNLTASAEGDAVSLSWEMPQDVSNLHWDSGENHDGIGVIGGGNIMGAARWEPAMLTDIHGHELRTIRFFIRDDYDVNIKVWTGELAETLLYEQEVETVTPMAWNEIDLSEPVTVDSAGWFWIGYEILNTVDETWPLGVDQGPAAEMYGDLVSVDDGATWLVLSWNGFDANVNIQGVVWDDLGNRATITPDVNTDSHSFDPTQSAGVLSGTADFASRENRWDVGITGFKIYRDGEEIDYLLEGNIRSYTDEFTVGGTFTYSYEVVAVYEGDVDSPASDPVEIEIVVVGVDELMVPERTELLGNYPNPFNPVTVIRYNLHEAQDIRLTVYNLIGQQVATLVSGEQAAGRYEVRWDGLNHSGVPLAGGMYIYRFETADYSKTMKMMYLK